jgi:hypothetical protein
MILDNRFAFTENQAWFHSKPRLVLPKITRGFTQNHTWFYSKAGVVLDKTTPAFAKADKVDPTQINPNPENDSISQILPFVWHNTTIKLHANLIYKSSIISEKSVNTHTHTHTHT